MKKRLGIMLSVFLIVTSTSLGQDGRHANQPLRICSNTALRDAIRIIQHACTETNCNFDALMALDRQVDKGALLAAFRDSDLKPVHIFFPLNEDRIEKSFDWKVSKKSQLDTIRYLSEPKRAAIFVIGRASTIGRPDSNRRLSIRRMQSILKYLKKDLKIDCETFYGGYLGAEIFQLRLTDARALNIEPTDFRNDEYILNQSVHIFVFPCGEML